MLVACPGFGWIFVFLVFVCRGMWSNLKRIWLDYVIGEKNQN